MNSPEMAVAFMRSASINQKQQSESIARQYKAIMAYAEQHGIKVQKTFDSNTRNVTEALRPVLDYCKENSEIRYVIVKDVSRISRSFEDYVRCEALCIQAGLEIRIADGLRVDVVAPTTEFMKALISTIGKLDSSRRSEMTKEKMLRRAKQGYSVHRPPIGYSTTNTSGLFELNLFGTFLREELQTMLINGTEAINPARTNLAFAFDPFASNPKPWKVSKIRRLVTNPYYTGFISCQGSLYKGLHEPILTPEEQQRLIELLNR